MPNTVKPTNNSTLIYRFVTQVFPLVKQELNRWREMAESSTEPSLSQQAVASIRDKSFHCQGGSIYALFPGVNTRDVVEFIVAYQTISDYLDNLVDSLSIHDEQAFAQLHLAMTEALDPGARTSDYYALYPYKNDGGYLLTLVETCRAKVSRLPAFHLVKEDMLWMAGLYSRLQSLKHLEPQVREEKMLQWLKEYTEVYPEISPWEFAAATGSTLGIFCLYAAASNENLTAEQSEQLTLAYFPWICGLHILLDYFIDLEEDRATEQLNFVQYYAGNSERAQRLQLFVREALERAASLPHANFHRAVVQGLLAMYLSDSKGALPDVRPTTDKLLSYGGQSVKLLHWICALLRKRSII